MRDFAQVVPTFWTGETGRAIRAIGRDAQLVALYLMTCPASNMIGLYYMPLTTLSFETGIPLQGASKALRSLCEIGFCTFEGDEGVVFVHQMARYQVGASLKPKDKRVKGVAREAAKFRKSKIYQQFWDMYAESYCLDSEPEASPLEAPSEPLRSQEKEKEKDKEKETEKESWGNSRSDSAPSKRFVPPTVEEVAAYCTERSNGVDAAKFVDYYAARGWKLGGSSMKDWRAAVRTWEKNQKEFSGNGKPNGSNSAIYDPNAATNDPSIGRL